MCSLTSATARRHRGSCDAVPPWRQIAPGAAEARKLTWRTKAACWKALKCKSLRRGGELNGTWYGEVTGQIPEEAWLG